MVLANSSSSNCAPFAAIAEYRITYLGVAWHSSHRHTKTHIPHSTHIAQQTCSTGLSAKTLNRDCGRRRRRLRLLHEPTITVYTDLCSSENSRDRKRTSKRGKGKTRRVFGAKVGTNLASCVKNCGLSKFGNTERR